MDSLEHLEEEMPSRELLVERGKALAAEAAEVIREHRDFDIVGLLLKADAPGIAAFGQAIEQATGQSLAGRVLRRVVTHQLVLGITRRQLRSSIGTGTGPPEQYGSELEAGSYADMGRSERW